MSNKSTAKDHFGRECFWVVDAGERVDANLDPQ